MEINPKMAEEAGKGMPRPLRYHPLTGDPGAFRPFTKGL